MTQQRSRSPLSGAAQWRKFAAAAAGDIVQSSRRT